MNEIGVAEEWRCLEIGAGRGSLAAWLCRKVGSNGGVTAIDKDARFLKSYSFDNLKIIKQDIRQYNPEAVKYDLIHARDVLVHIENREEVLERLIRGLKYGGWILLEEPDVITDTADPLSPRDKRELYQSATESIYRFLQGRGLDPYFGRSIFGILKASGFARLQAEGRVYMFSGGKGQVESPHMMAFEQLKDAITQAGLIAESEFSKFLELAKDPTFAWREGLTMSVWGQRCRSGQL